MTKENDQTAPLAGTTVKGVGLRVAGIGSILSAAVLITAICRAEPKDIPKIVEIVFGSNTYQHTGWVVATLVLIGCAIFYRILRTTYQQEINRLSAERTELQKKLLKQIPPPKKS